MIVHLFTRPDCTLCDAWSYELEDLRDELGFVYKRCSLEEGVLPPHLDPALVPIVAIYPHTDSVDDAIQWLQPPSSQRDLRHAVRQAANRL